ncbi:hypothetical protein ACU57_00365 [Escherichia coli]|uniref:Uncharacterized protein n=1 Tax=Escherichia coli TaxID=562 RepID=A0A0P7MD97_ECOLX|nr:hypothetical protein ACU57_00365 [Escherichia coli]
MRDLILQLSKSSIYSTKPLIHNRTTKKQEIIWQHTYTYDIYYKEDKRAQQINSFIIWSCKEITNNPHDKQAGTCKKTQIPCMHIYPLVKNSV